MGAHFADRLQAAVAERGAPICVGIDPVVERLPPAVLQQLNRPGAIDRSTVMGLSERTIADAFVTYGCGVIEAVADIAPAVKINVAFFERYHLEGMRAFHELIRTAQRAGLLVIADVKRADIGHTSEAYADSLLVDAPSQGFDGPALPDAVTVNPYFGIDGVRPFIERAQRSGRGVFVLVQTSNESAHEIQNLSLADGRPVSEQVAQLVDAWGSGSDLIGASGYSCVGAVVSPRDLAATDRLRRLMPHTLFLVPGFGAQGRTAVEVARCFDANGNGALVTASRSVGFAFAEPQVLAQADGDWKRCVAAACRDFLYDVREALSRAR